MNRNSRWVWLVVVLALAVSVTACGKKEAETPSQPAATAPKAQPVDPATAATVSGTVKLEGAAPRATRVRMDADPVCAKAHTSAVGDNEVVVSNGMLANAVIYVKDGLGSRTFDTPQEPVVLDQRGCLYTPRVISVQASQPVHIKNSDPTTHNIHPVPQNNQEWNKSQPPGATDLNEKFAREEVAITVKCNVHPWMKSYIAVLRHPYHSVSSTDGSFSLKNLPPGDYVVAAWHERLGTSEQKVTVGASESKAIEFVFKQ